MTEASIDSAITLLIAFLTSCIKYKTPTNASNGNAIAVNARTPTSALIAFVPIKDSTAITPVIAAVNIDSAITLLIAFLTSCIKYKTPTNASNGNAIAVNARTPANALKALVPIFDNINITPVIA